MVFVLDDCSAAHGFVSVGVWGFKVDVEGGDGRTDEITSVDVRADSAASVVLVAVSNGGICTVVLNFTVGLFSTSSVSVVGAEVVKLSVSSVSAAALVGTGKVVEAAGLPSLFVATLPAHVLQTVIIFPYDNILWKVVHFGW